MASKLTTPAGSPAKQKHSPKKAKKKRLKEKQSPNGESEMGCSPSQAVIVSSNRENSHMHPTIYMVGEKSLQMLKDLGELKFYHFAQYNEAHGNAHNDFAAVLENPLLYSGKDGQSEFTRGASSCRNNYSGEERSINSKKKAACVIDDPGWNTNFDLTNQRSVNLSNVFASKATNPAPILLSPESLAHSKGIKIAAENTVMSPILLSGATRLNAMQNKVQNLSCSNKSTFSVNAEARITDTKGTSSMLNTAPDPMDKIVSSPDERCTTLSALTNDDSVAPKIAPKTFFGRNRIKPKQEASNAYAISG